METVVLGRTYCFDAMMMTRRQSLGGIRQVSLHHQGLSNRHKGKLTIPPTVHYRHAFFH